LHADLILKALDKWKIKPEEIDVIASHGQTIYHAPKSLHRLAGYPNGTLQIGDGDHIAVKTGIITICDFRQKHIAAGGEGAPLAVYGDYLLFSKQGENRIMLNIGGIANFTYLSGDGDAGKMFSTDVGPGNTIMDQFIQKNYSGLYFDEGGRLAMDGTVNEKLLSALLDLEFFNANFPKTTGPELFNLTYLEKAQAKSNTADISNEDVMATLNRFTGQVIVNAISVAKKGNTDNPVAVYLSGGGMHNSVLCSFLKGSLPEVQFYTTADLGIEPDAKEAVLFALLANETLVGEGIGFGNGEDVPAVNMGKICFPY
ncbi:MAG: anhydro-N-acetylmuramic acid kinase, partial [Pedobacter sp.]